MKFPIQSAESRSRRPSAPRVLRGLFFNLLLVSLVGAGASARAQSSLLDKKVTLSLSGVRIAEVLRALEEQTGATFVYSSTLLEGNGPLNVTYRNQRLGDVLTGLLGESARGIRIQGSRIHIRPLKGEPRGTVRGVVTDRAGQPVPYASVRIKSLGTGTQTRADGTFELAEIPEGKYELQLSCLGYGTLGQSITVTAGQTLQAGTIVLEENNEYLGEVVVTAGRKSESINEVPSSVTILNSRQIEQQTAINNSITAILGNTVPGLGTFTNKATNSGQTLRGRSVLILIDGIPQSTPLMNGNRDMRTLDPAIVERVEVIKGATSIYGNGSGGGIINFITKSPDPKRPFGGQTTAGINGNITHTAETLGYRVSQTFHGTLKKFSYIANGTYNQTGVLKDARGKVIAQEDGLSQTHLWNIYGKAAYRPNRQSEITLSYNLFKSEQKSDYINQAGIYGVSPAVGIRGEDPGAPAGTPHNHNAYLAYRLSELPLRTTLDFSLYHHRFQSMNRWVASTSGFYGSGQTKIQSTKKGLRLNLNTPWKGKKWEGEVTYGIDLLGDVTNQVLTDGRVYIPNMNMVNFAPYAQLKIDLFTDLILKGGMRYENARVKIADYRTLATGPGDEGSIAVTGGTIPYNAVMFNAGARYTRFELFNPFLSFSQAFAINELGRILRRADQNTLALLQTDPIITNNYEAGFSSRFGNLTLTAAYYISTSRLGANLVDVGGYLKPERDPERIHGYELTVDARLLPRLTVGGSYAYVDGKAEKDDGTRVYLTGARIAPPKGTAYIYYQPVSRLNLQLFFVHSGKRDRFAPRSNGKYANSEGPVKPVNLFNLNASFEISKVLKAGLGVENLLNTTYYPSLSQYRAFDAEYVRGNGARFNLNLSYSF